MQIRVLGPIEIVDGSNRLRPGGRKQRLVLAVLAARLGEMIPTDGFIEALWPGELPGDPRHALQNAISSLRRDLDSAGGPGRRSLRSVPGGYVLSSELDLDAREFEGLIERAGTERGAGREARTLLEAAVGLWRGPAFGEFGSVDALAAGAARLEELRLQAEETLAELSLERGDGTAAVTSMSGILAAHPGRSRPRRVLASGGRHRGAKAPPRVETSLLDAAPRRMVGRLSVFAEPFTLAAAAAVGGDAGEPAQASRRTLARLIAAGQLKRAEGERWRVRSPQSFRLDAEVRLRHSEYVHSQVVAAAFQASADPQASLGALERLDADAHAAAEWALEAGRPEIAAGMIVAMGRYLDLTGQLPRALAMLERALEGEMPPSRMRLEGLVWAAYYSTELGRPRHAQRHAAAALRVGAELGGESAAAGALSAVAIADRRSAPRRATGAASRAIELAEREGPDSRRAHALSVAAETHRIAGSPRTAVDTADAAYRLYDDLGDRQGLAWSLISGAGALVKIGDAPAARERCDEGFALGLDLGDMVALGRVLEVMADLDAASRRTGTAARRYGAAAALEAQRSVSGTPAHLRIASKLAPVRAALGPEFDRLWSRGADEALHGPELLASG